MKAKFLIPILLCMVFLVPQVSAFQWCEWIPFWDCNDPIILVDHTIYDALNNKVTGERFNFKIDVYPANMQDADGKNIEQYVNFSYNGLNDVNGSMVFIYSGEIQNGKIELLKTVTESYQDGELFNDWGKITVNDLISQENLGLPQENNCDVGNINNTRMWLLTSQYPNGTSYQKTYCFTNFVQLDNSTVQLSGNYDNYRIINKTRNVERWVDVSDKIQFLGNNLNNQGYSYYKITQQRFATSKTYQTRWTYTPRNSFRSGKWSILAYRSETGLMNAIENDQYLFLDPWWDNSWIYKKNITGISGEFPSFNISYATGMQTDFDDLRFLDSTETTELNFTLRDKVNGQWAYVTVDTNEETTIYMYFNNGAALSASSVNNTFYFPPSSYLLDVDTNDDTGAYNFNSSNTVQTTGYILNGTDFEKDDNSYLLSDYPSFTNTDSFSVSFWFKAETINNVMALMDSGKGANKYQTLVYTDAGSGNINYQTFCRDTGSITLLTGGAVSVGNWKHIVISHDGSTRDVKLYVDGLSVGNGTESSNCASGTQFILGTSWLGSTISTSNDADGVIDEVLIFDKVLTTDQILELYNISNLSATFGATESVSTLNITLIEPEDNTLSNSENISFECICEEINGCISLNMTIDNQLVNYTSNTTANQNLTVVYNNVSIPDGSYQWYCTGEGTIDTINSTFYSFSVDTILPNITLNAPQETYGTLLDGETINLNYSISDSNLDTCWYEYPFTSTETYQYYETDGTNARLIDLNNDGTNDLTTVEVVFGDDEVRLDDYSGSGLSNRSTSRLDCNSVSYDVGGGSGNAKNWSIGDYFCVNTTAGDKILFQMTSANSPAYSPFNITVAPNIETVLNCSLNTTTFNYSTGYNTINVFANDTFGNVNNQSRSWQILFTVNDVVFENSSYETDYNSFFYNITFASAPLSITSLLYYNNTNYTSTSTCSGVTCIITNDIDLPLVQDTSSNNSLYWEITIFNGTGTSSYTSSTYYQELKEINFSQCDATLNVTTLNYSAYDERDKSLLTPFEFAGDFEYYLGSGTVKKNLSLGNSSVNNYIDFCYSPSNRTLYLDSEIEYYKNDTTRTYKARNYYTDNASLTNTSQDIFLYLLDEDFATSFILEVLDQSNDAVSSAFIYIQRCYVDTGNCETVQIAKTDENGKTLGFYEVETVDYKHLIYKDGELLLDQSKAKVFPEETPYTLIFRVGDAILYPWVYLVDNPSITISLSHNSTSNITSFSWIDASGSVSEGTLKVYQNLFNISDELICESSASFSSATVTCDLTGYDGSFVAYAYLDGEVVDIIRYSIDDNFSTFGNYGVMIGFFIILFVTLLFIWNPTAMVIMHNVATIFVWIIGFISFSPIYIFAMMGVSVLIIILLKT